VVLRAAPSHAGGDRTAYHPPDPAAHQLEQAGSREHPRALPPDAVQQDAQARHPRPEGGGRGGRGRVTARRYFGLVRVAAWRGVGELFNSDGMTHAASIAYYTLLSLFPLFLLMLSLLGSLTADQTDRDAVVG